MEPPIAAHQPNTRQLDTRQLDTRQLVERARSGSQDAFTELVRRFQGPVRGFLCRYLRDEQAADDVAQEVFLAAFRQMGEHHGAAPFSSWLMGVARNQALAYLRREIRFRRRQDVVATQIAQQHVRRLQRWDDVVQESDSDQPEDLTALNSCINQLPPTSKSVLQRFYFDRESAQSIGQSMNKKSGAVRMLLLRIRQTLRKCMQAKRAEVDR